MGRPLAIYPRLTWPGSVRYRCPLSCRRAYLLALCRLFGISLTYLLVF